MGQRLRFLGVLLVGIAILVIAKLLEDEQVIEGIGESTDEHDETGQLNRKRIPKQRDGGKGLPLQGKALEEHLLADVLFRRVRDLAAEGKLKKDPKKKPEGLHVDLKHLSRCTSCWDLDATAFSSLIWDEIGTVKQSLADDQAVMGWQNLKRTLLRPEKQEVQSLSKQGVFFYASGLFDGSIFKLWAPRQHLDLATGISTYEPYSLFTSLDGKEWKRKEQLTGIVHDLDRKTADVHDGSMASLTVEYSEKIGFYLGGYQCMRYNDKKTMIRGDLNCIARSRDGVHWSSNIDGDSLGRAGDSYNQYYFNLQTQRINAVWRKDFGTGRFADWRNIRGIQFGEFSPKDGRFKQLESQSFYLDRAGKMEKYRRQIYAFTVQQYSGLYLAICTVLEYPKLPVEDQGDDNRGDSTNVFIATSRDGAIWDFDWIYAEQTLIPKGASRTDFDHGFILPAAQFIDTPDHHLLYYEARSACHHENRFNCPPRVGMAKWELGRLVGIEPSDPAEWGVLVTKGFTLKSSQLLINAKPLQHSAACTVSVLDYHTQKPISVGTASMGYGGNHIKVQWQRQSQSDLARKVGSLVRLKFRLRSTMLFGFEFRSGCGGWFEKGCG
jgi:hypothetical protein